MTHTLGVDIGTFESKGVLVTARGEVVASAVRPHRMLVPQPGWAEHRPDEDWWDDLVAITRELLEVSGLRPTSIDAVAGPENNDIGNSIPRAISMTNADRIRPRSNFNWDRGMQR